MILHLNLFQDNYIFIFWPWSPCLMMADKKEGALLMGAKERHWVGKTENYYQVSTWTKVGNDAGVKCNFAQHHINMTLRCLQLHCSVKTSYLTWLENYQSGEETTKQPQKVITSFGSHYGKERRGGRQLDHMTAWDENDFLEDDSCDCLQLFPILNPSSQILQFSGTP